MPGTNVITFPSTPPFAQLRKRGAATAEQNANHIASNLPALIDDVKLDIALAWDRGVRMGFLAKMHQLTIAQTEAIIWEARSLRNRPRPGFGLHVVTRRAA